MHHAHRFIACAALVLASHTAQACQDLSMGLHLASHHFNGIEQGKRYNNANHGAYVVCNGWSVGTYTNSADATTTWAGYSLKYGPVALTLGAATGYPGQRLAPIGLVSVGLPAGLRLGAFPSRGEHSGGVHLMWEMRL
jgi:hypothetical protein